MSTSNLLSDFMSKFGNECKKYKLFSLYTKINCKEAQEQVGRVMKLQDGLNGFFAKTTNKFDCKVIDKFQISLSQKYKEVYDLKEKIDFIIPKLDKIQSVINVNYDVNISEIESRLDNLISMNTQLTKTDIYKNYQSIDSYEDLNNILSNIYK